VTAAAGQLASVWPTALALLWDRSAAVRGNVAPILGRLGAIAADPGIPTSGIFLSFKTGTRVLLALGLSSDFPCFFDNLPSVTSGSL
jgi:hypothetical protein